MAITLLTRKQFRQHWNEILDGLGDNDSKLWVIEKTNADRCRWFVCISPLHQWNEFVDESHTSTHKQEFWRWCRRHCRGKVLCYASSFNDEWWGFTIYEDIVPWILKWS